MSNSMPPKGTSVLSSKKTLTLNPRSNAQSIDKESSLVTPKTASEATDSVATKRGAPVIEVRRKRVFLADPSSVKTPPVLEETKAKPLKMDAPESSSSLVNDHPATKDALDSISISTINAPIHAPQSTLKSAPTLASGTVASEAPKAIIAEASIDLINAPLSSKRITSEASLNVAPADAAREEKRQQALAEAKALQEFQLQRYQPKKAVELSASSTALTTSTVVTPATTSIQKTEAATETKKTLGLKKAVGPAGLPSSEKTRSDAPRHSRDAKSRPSLQRGAPAHRQPLRSHRSKGFDASMPQAIAPLQGPKKVTITEGQSIAEMAKNMSIKASELIKTFMKLGQMLSINAIPDLDSAMLVALELGFEPRAVTQQSAASVIETFGQQLKDQYKEQAVLRAPTVSILGHVDHGKTTLLDALRQTHVAQHESGGITQKMAAWRMHSEQGDVVFIDTPGHSAFESMRGRGAKLSDIALLIVALDDGVKPQTQESILRAREAGAPIVVALTKKDKPGGDAQRIKADLAALGVVCEELGGDVPLVSVSAKTKEGLNDLLEMLILQGAVLELKAAATGPAQGRVIESHLEKGRGSVAQLLVQSGSLSAGSFLVAGAAWTRVRALSQPDGSPLAKAGPSEPVLTVGWSEPPVAGELFVQVKTEKEAKSMALACEIHLRELKLSARQHQQRSEHWLTRDLPSQNMGGSVLSGMSSPQEAGQASISEDITVTRTKLNLIIKTDAQGSLEALTQASGSLGNAEVGAFMVHSGIGEITANDVLLARDAKAMIIGFNVKPNADAKRLAHEHQVKILAPFSVIYHALDQIKLALSALLSPLRTETVQGKATILKVFTVSKVGVIAGCRARMGVIKKTHWVKVYRKGILVAEGQALSLMQGKSSTTEVASGLEFGVSVQNFEHFMEHDELEFVDVQYTTRTL